MRGTFADDLGNISAVEEPADLDSYSIALAAKNSGGIVIAQVRETVRAGRLRPREVSIPGNLVDYVFVDPAPGHRPTTAPTTSPWQGSGSAGGCRS